MLWENLREEEFEEAIKSSGGLCVIPLGCLEKHGQHLPVGTDSLKAEAIVRLAAEKTNVVVFSPGLSVGDVICAHGYKNPGETHHRGYIAMNPNTLLTVLDELCEEIARNGFRKILIVSSHGGNGAMLSYFLRANSYKGNRPYALLTHNLSLALCDPDKMVAMAEASPEEFSMLTEEDMKVLRHFAETGTGGGHADFRETGLIYGTYPELVAPDRFDAEDGSNTERADYLHIGMGVNHNYWDANSPNAFNGFPSFGCSPTIGDAMVKICVDSLVDIFEKLKKDEECVRMAMGLPKGE
jgi:creatinine amidohydrolase